MNWVDMIKNSIPDHSKDIGMYLDTFINHSSLDKVDAHACALTAALSAGNGALAYLIQSSEVLANTPECEAAKTAAPIVSLYNSCLLTAPVLDLDTLNLPALDLLTPAGITAKKFQMYGLCASIVSNSLQVGDAFTSLLLDAGTTNSELVDIVKIAGVINAVGKIAPPG